MIIKPPKLRRYPDPYIAPNYGTRGPCALCLNYSDLTENHIPPQGVGNTDRWSAQSYMVASAANDDLYFGRRFNGGIRFRTLCAECNNGLGGSEDKALIDLFASVRRAIETPVLLLPRVKIAARPNLIYRGLLAHMVSANDSGAPSNFDSDARQMFFKKKELRQGGWNLFYWIYTGDSLFMMRHAYYTTWYPEVRVVPIIVLKFYPLAFMFTQQPWFFGLPNLRNFLVSEDDEEADVPFLLHQSEGNPAWPVIPEGMRNLIMLAGNSFGLIGKRG